MENETINNDNRNDINTVFDISKSIRLGHPPESGVYSKQSMTSIKRLSLLLLKRELINQSIRISNISKSKDSIQQKVIHLNEQIVDREQETKDISIKLQNARSKLLEAYENKLDETKFQEIEIRQEKIVHIQKQTLLIQYYNFKVLKETMFTSKKHHILLFNLPVVNISEFFTLHNKLFQLNAFLENIINLQVKLVKVLDLEISQLPYLQELMEYLPDTKFYDLVQQKEDFMIHGGQMESDREEQIGTVDIKDLLLAESEKIVKLGNMIKLPLSSKTINNQLRRASMVKAQEEPRDQEKLPDRPLTEERRPSMKSNISGKKVVIVPHKILTKPLTKLTSKEYLKFLLIIVKILVNFKVFFGLTSNTVPRPQNTISQARDSVYSNHKVDDFTEVIDKVVKLDDYFGYKLNKVQQKNLLRKKSSQFSFRDLNITQSEMSIGNVKGSTSNVNSIAHSSISSLIQKDDSKDTKSTNATKPGIRGLYKNLFKDNGHQEMQEIYGDFSETLNSPVDKDSSIEKPPENELKGVMQQVHKMMVTGSSRDARHQRDLPSSTFNMMNQSKTKLDEWDVVSKMYT